MQATAEALEINELITGALTAIVRDYRPTTVGAHRNVGADGTLGPRHVAAAIAWRQIPVQLPEEGRDRGSTSPSRWRHCADNRCFFGHRS